MEWHLSRIIRTESVGKERDQLVRSLIYAIRLLSQRNEKDSVSTDLAAFITITLNEIYTTIETSVAAWEKRGYWIKADRFQMEWKWADQYSDSMRCALFTDDWKKVASIAALIMQKLQKVTVPARNRMGEPWIGAWQLLREQEKLTQTQNKR